MMIAVIDIEKNTIKLFQKSHYQKAADYIFDIQMREIERTCGNVDYVEPCEFKHNGEVIAYFDRTKINVILDYDMWEETKLYEVKE